MEGMDAAQLGRWIRFAAKGGIGRATALVDYVAERPQDLMFLKVLPLLLYSTTRRGLTGISMGKATRLWC